MLTVGSLFSGIGGFDLGFERAGFQIAWQLDNDDFCRRVLTHHWRDTSLFRDVRECGKTSLPAVDVITWGFPCQDVSIAGKRKGLHASRTGLFFEGVRILRELQPAWTVIENVLGLMSQSYGADFATVLSELESVGYVGGWRVLDSRWFGVPQRRRRVFLVGHLGNRSRAESVLFESARGAWGSPTRDETGADTAYCLNASVRKSGDGHGQGWNTTYVNALCLIGGGADDNDAQAGHLIHALSAAKSGQRFDPNGEDYVLTGPLGGGNDGIGRRTEDDPNLVYQCHGSNVGPMGTLRQGDGGLTSGVPFVAQTLCGRSHGDGVNMPGRGGEDDWNLVAFTLRSSDGHHGHSSARGDGCDNLVAGVHANQRGELRTSPLAGSLTQSRSGKQYEGVFDQGVRRLTPLECERLQGFPDGFTCLCGCEPYSTAACRCPDSPRYRVLGNAVTANVAAWIAHKLRAVMEQG